METATLTSPPRPVMVQPVQKSMSLPSYARASGEGIDHKLIFAALEQREKIRQKKNRIFRDKEKTGTSRQRSYFCLPLSSTSKCKETSLSSDTSCSSLEFQKPKHNRESPAKLRKQRDDRTKQNGVKNTEISSERPGNIDMMESASQTPSPLSVDHGQLYGRIRSSSFRSSTPDSLKKAGPIPSLKEPLLRNEPTKSTLGSSDSMERAEKSSRSSNDSLSRKERLVAIKARVEAERLKKLQDSSSDDEGVETSLKITRHNSDGVIIRTVREVKTRSFSRPERRSRRKNQEELLARRAARKQHTSLYLPSTTDLEAWKPAVPRSGSSLSLHGSVDGDDVTITKDFMLPSGGSSRPSFLFPNSLYKYGTAKENYHSDICSGSYRSRFVKPRIEEFERKERITKAKDDISQKTEEDYRQPGITSVFNIETHSNITRSSGSANGSKISLDSLDASLDRIRKCVSPNPRAPTPPPRSPKSIEFVNKAILQHQNTTNSFQPEAAYSLERKQVLYQTRAPHQGKNNESAEQLKDVIISRRKTCSNFPTSEDYVIPERSKTPTLTSQQQSRTSSHNFPPRSPDLIQKATAAFSRKTKGLASSPEMNVKHLLVSGEPQSPRKWEQVELDSEKKFNSLDNSKMNSWLLSSKFKCLPRKKRACSCSSSMNPNHASDNNVCSCSAERVSDKPPSPSSLHRKTQENSSRTMTNLLFEPISKPSSQLVESLMKSDGTSVFTPDLRSPKGTVKNSPLLSQRRVTSPDHDSLTRKDATENLNTAMQELEDIYRSLRISCENLTEYTTNGDDKNISAEKQATRNLTDMCGSDRVTIESSVRPIDEDVEKMLNEAKNSGRYNPIMKHPSSPSPTPALKVKPAADTLCIEELFSDLTQQLDFEQKLLAETRTKKLPASPVLNRAAEKKSAQVSHANPTVIGDQKYVTNAVTTEFQSVDQNEENYGVSSFEHRILSKKKHKAVRSLSANIANLMGISRRSPVPSDPVPDQKTPNLESYDKDKSSYPKSKWDFTGSERNDDYSYELLKRTGRGSDSKSFVPPTNLTDLKKKRCPGGTNPDEIWQIRVSMDPGDLPMKSSARCSAAATSIRDDRSSSPSLRLQTVLNDTTGVGSADSELSSQNGGGVVVPHQQHSTSQSLVGDKLHHHTSGKKPPSPVPINDAELEKLLTTLLSDVTNGTLPEINSPPASLCTSKAPSTCSDSFVKGEMLVLQHIDVIRNRESS